MKTKHILFALMLTIQSLSAQEVNWLIQPGVQAGGIGGRNLMSGSTDIDISVTKRTATGQFHGVFISLMGTDSTLYTEASWIWQNNTINKYTYGGFSYGIGIHRWADATSITECSLLSIDFGGNGNDERCITYEVPKELVHSGFGITIPLQAYYGIRFSYIGFGVSGSLPLRVSLGDIDMETISFMIGLKASVFI